jgi:hypothetical protein
VLYVLDDFGSVLVTVVGSLLTMCFKKGGMRHAMRKVLSITFCTQLSSIAHLTNMKYEYINLVLSLAIHSHSLPH